MTIEKAAEKILGNATFDTALPLTWCDQVNTCLGEWPREFVWAYDPLAPVGVGRPCALTPAANLLLDRYNRMFGSHYPLAPNPIKEEEA